MMKIVIQMMMRIVTKIIQEKKSESNSDYFIKENNDKIESKKVKFKISKIEIPSKKEMKENVK